MDEIKLEPCPFCGGEAKTESSVDVIPAYDENGAYVDYLEMIYNEQTGCPACDIWFYIGEDEPDGITIERWNRRAWHGRNLEHEVGLANTAGTGI